MKPIGLPILLLALCSGVPAAAEEPEPETLDTQTRFVFDMRLAAGGSYKIMDDRAEWGIGMDFSVLFRIDVGGTGHTIMPEFGYSASLHDENRIQDHYFIGGVGYGLSGEWYTIGIVPSFVAGSVQGFHHGREMAYGYRTALIAEVPRIVGVQAAHQVMVLENGEIEHQFLLTGSFNLGLIILLMHLG
ncbi:MAG: hypothetical protein JXR96_11615 [Deltaproteobacteria bacterium]|nr:hypothetical protein [Deltaproteobacteria bacterium]